MFFKVAIMLLSFFMMIFIVIVNKESDLNLVLKFFSFNLDSLVNYNLSLMLDYNTLTYLFMVSLVASAVSLFSNIYMEHYNNKKFLSLMMLFFGSMTLLCSSGSFIVLMIGWDGLGLSSIFLIMFYPNKTTHYNSILTMFFNRVGDVALILVLSKMMTSLSQFYSLNQKMSVIILSVIIFCSFTKSAQFPLSSWLPAAMSAPTPISAMVHSSTLVTAGIFMCNNFCFYFKNGLMMETLASFCILTFLMGGALASMEKDFKKTVAFSTMSQISMIMLFSSICLVFLSLSHMMFHAFFKTLLFICSGVIFMMFYGKQLKNFMKANKNIFLLNLMFMSSIYSMSGLVFSSSFFSKDLIIETFNNAEESYMMEFMMLGSLLTLVYSSKLMISSKTFVSKTKMLSLKNFNFCMMMALLAYVLYSGQLLKFMFNLDWMPLISQMNLALILLLFALPMTKDLYKKNANSLNQKILIVAQSIALMKLFTFSILSAKMKTNYVMNLTQSDSMMFKMVNFNSKKIGMKKILTLNKTFSVLMFAFSMLTFWCF